METITSTRLTPRVWRIEPATVFRVARGTFERWGWSLIWLVSLGIQAPSQKAPGPSWHPPQSHLLRRHDWIPRVTQDIMTQPHQFFYQHLSRLNLIISIRHLLTFVYGEISWDETLFPLIKQPRPQQAIYPCQCMYVIFTYIGVVSFKRRVQTVGSIQVYPGPSG